MGGSADKRYNMSFIVQNSVELGTPIIGVSLNYRLSVFGFPGGKEAFNAGAANLGFRDQRLALRWVNENIASFGGAPNKVAIFGESSGAESVSAQVLAYNGVLSLPPSIREQLAYTQQDVTTASSEQLPPNPALAASSPGSWAGLTPQPISRTMTNLSATSHPALRPSAPQSR